MVAEEGKMKDCFLAEHSLEAGDAELASSPIYPGSMPAELPEHVRGLPQVGAPHSDVHETEDEKRNRLSDQRIAVAKARLCPNS